MKTLYCFCLFYQKLLVQSRKSFQKAASSHVSGFPKAVEVYNFRGFFHTVFSGFQPIHVAILLQLLEALL
jgi:predicted nucleotide-binding protein (sugar kinase/HSP70/actin superfamily)